MGWEQTINSLYRGTTTDVTVRAIELALDNGEFGSFPPSEREWNSFERRFSYLDDAAQEIRRNA